MKFDKKKLIWLLVLILVVGGYLYSRQAKDISGNYTAVPENNVNVENISEGGNTNIPDNTSQNSNTNTSSQDNTSQNNSANTNIPDNTSQNSNANTNIPDNTSQNSSANANTAENSANNGEANTNDSSQGPVYYTSDILDELTGTEIFNKSAIEHIFIGSVNSSGKGSGYHYAMISDAKGKIVEGTKSKLDKNGLYTANVEVDGHPKNSFSTFYPDNWSPQQIVDAIAVAREDALKTGKMSGDYHVGYANGIQINMYFDSKDKIVTAFPVYNKGK